MWDQYSINIYMVYMITLHYSARIQVADTLLQNKQVCITFKLSFLCTILMQSFVSWGSVTCNDKNYLSVIKMIHMKHSCSKLTWLIAQHFAKFRNVKIILSSVNTQCLLGVDTDSNLSRQCIMNAHTWNTQLQF
jgi:hypothetical protein